MRNAVLAHSTIIKKKSISNTCSSVHSKMRSAALRIIEGSVHTPQEALFTMKVFTTFHFQEPKLK